VYAKRWSPALVVDLATLTQSVHTALGDAYAGLFASDDGARDLVVEAAEWAGESVWPLPIHPTHVDSLRHARAELANTTERGGGACIAAAFLQHFTDYPWAHIDMGGKAMAGSDRSDVREGATGFGTRLLIRLAQLFARQQGA
jgi:leucyl aminopeptidase